MRKITTFLFTLFLSSLIATAQNGQKHSARSVPDTDGAIQKQRQFVKPANHQADVVIWSEDFANGIPATWVNAGFDNFGSTKDSALWEYRGPNTSPGVTTGSRGAYAGTRGPINSPTASNGFIIFDSDYLDNGGVAGNFGNGKAPSPHIGTLTTGTINLSGYSNVGLKVNSYHRYFEGRALVAFSTNGGTTWTDTLEIHPGLGVNNETMPNSVVQINVSYILGNQSNVKLRFIFDGTYDDPGANGSGFGYYFWMLDDIELYEVPKHDIRFTAWQGAPAQDFLCGPAPGSTKMGHVAIVPPNKLSDQTREITFDANAFNFGWGSLNGVQLKVHILDLNNTPITTLTSTGSANLNSNDTANYNTLNTYTTPYTPPALGTYRFYYEAVADSASVTSDTLEFYVTETQNSSDFKVFSNSLGTPQLGNDASAIGTRIDFVDLITIDRVWIGLSSLTQPGAVLEIEVYDTAGFDYLTGFPTTNLVATSLNAYTITQADIDSGFVVIQLTNGNSNWVVLNGASYFFVARMYSNAGSNILRIRNDQTFPQPAFSKIMYNTTDARWYSGYSGNLNLNAPHIRALARINIGLEEDVLAASIKLAPNPASDYVNITFGESGNYALRLIDVTGKIILEKLITTYGEESCQIDLSKVAAGSYFLNINNGNAAISKKLIKY